MNFKARTTLHITLWTGVIVLFLALRLIHLSQVLVAPPGQILIIDSLYYYQWAERIASGMGVGNTVFFMSPLYPFLLAFSMLLSEYNVLAATLIQVMISAGTLALIGKYATDRFGTVAGLIAGLIYSLYAPSIYYDSVLLSANLILFLTMLALVFLDASNNRGRLWIIAAGIAIGLSSLARPNTLILLPVLAILFIKKWKRFGWEQSAILLITVCITIFPAGLHNYLAGGEWYLTTSSAGVNYYIGNHEKSIGLYSEVPWLTSAEPAFEAGDYQKEAQRRLGKEISHSQSSRFWMKEGLKWGFSHPVEWTILQGKKLFYFLNRVETPNNVSIYGVKEYSKILVFLSFLNFGIIAPFGLVGLFLARHDKDWSIPAVVVAAYTLASILFFVSGEYRYPIMGIIITYASGAIVRISSLLKARKVDRAQMLMIGILTLLLICNIPWKTMKQIASPRMDYFNWASVSFAKGDLANASLLFTATLAWDPTWIEAHIQLAQVYDELSLPELADREYAAAGITREELLEARKQSELMELLPDSLRADYDKLSPGKLAEIGFRFIQLEKYHQAVAILEKATELDSTNLQASFNYAFALEATGRYQEGLDIYLELEQKLPEDPMIPYRIAWSFFALGHHSTAVNTLKRVTTKAINNCDQESLERWKQTIDKTRDAFMNF